MSENHTFPHSTPIKAFGADNSVYLCGQSVARLNCAVQGLHALAALLGQREIDGEVDMDDPATFGPGVALGILSAIACCAEVVDSAANGTIFPTALSVRAGTPEHELLSRAACEAGRMKHTRTAPNA